MPWTGNAASLVHNPYIRGDFAFISPHNTESMPRAGYRRPGGASGSRLLRYLQRRERRLHVPGPPAPYLPSGRIIGGNREDGLYVWTFNNIAPRFATVPGSGFPSGAPIFNAAVQVDETQELFTSDMQGNLKEVICRALTICRCSPTVTRSKP